MNSAGHLTIRLESGRIGAREQMARFQNFQGNPAKFWPDSWPDSPVPIPAKFFSFAV